VPTHRESSANSITVALPAFLAVSFLSLIAWKIRRTENPVLAAASLGAASVFGLDFHVIRSYVCALR
jgi:hypothetical protein